MQAGGQRHPPQRQRLPAFPPLALQRGQVFRIRFCTGRAKQIQRPACLRTAGQRGGRLLQRLIRLVTALHRSQNPTGCRLGHRLLIAVRFLAVGQQLPLRHILPRHNGREPACQFHRRNLAGRLGIERRGLWFRADRLGFPFCIFNAQAAAGKMQPDPAEIRHPAFHCRLGLPQLAFAQATAFPDSLFRQQAACCWQVRSRQRAEINLPDKAWQPGTEY